MTYWNKIVDVHETYGAIVGAIYATGRTRRYSYKGAFSVGGTSWSAPSINNGMAFDYSNERYAFDWIRQGGVYCSASLGWTPGDRVGAPNLSWSGFKTASTFNARDYCELYLEAFTGYDPLYDYGTKLDLGDNVIAGSHQYFPDQSRWAQIYNPVTSSFNAPWNSFYTGTYSGFIDVAEYVQILWVKSGAFPSPSNFPRFFSAYTPNAGSQTFNSPNQGVYSGKSFWVPDSGFTLRGTFFEAPRAGGQSSISASIGPLTAGGTDTIPDQHGVFAISPLSFVPIQQINGSSKNSDKTPAISAVMSDDKGNSFDCGSYSLPLSNSSGTVYAQKAPLRTVSLSGRIRAMDVSYPSPVGAVLHYNGLPAASNPTPFGNMPINWYDGGTDIAAGVPGDDRIASDGSGIVSRIDSQSYTNIQIQNPPLTGGYVGGQITYSNTLGRAHLHLDPDWLDAHGETVSDCRIAFCGPVFKPFNLSHAPSLMAADCSTLNGWIVGANAVISLTNGSLTASVSGSSGTGSIKRIFLPSEMDVAVDGLGGVIYSGKRWGKDWTAYSYLDVTVKSVNLDKQPLRVTITSNPNIGDPPVGFQTVYPIVTRSYDLVTGPANTFTTLSIDLCTNPASTLTVDPRDTRFPLPTLDTDMAGMTYISSITIENLASGETYVISGLNLSRKKTVNATFLPSLNAYHIVNPGYIGYGDTTLVRDPPPGFPFFYPNRGVLASTDGRASLDEPYIYEAYYPGTGGTDYFMVSMNGMADQIAQHPGWTVSSRAPADSSVFPNLTLSAAYLFGGGALYDHASKSWISGFDLDAGSVGVLAQPLFDEIDWYPWIGNPWDGSDFSSDTALPLVFTKILRGGAWGIVLDGNKARSSSVSVTTLESATQLPSGSGTTNSQGQYITRDPYGRPGNHDILENSDSLSVTEGWYARRRRRVAFAQLSVNKISQKICLMRDYTGQLFVFYISAAGNLIRSKYDMHGETVHSDHIIDSSPKCVCPNFYLHAGRITGTYISDSAPIFSISRDHGANFIMTSIPGSYQAIVSDEHSGRILAIGFVKDSAPAITGQWYPIVGKDNQDGTYTWSTGPALALSPAATAAAYLRCRRDGVAEFTYIDSAGASHIIRGRGIGLSGSGIWS